MGRTSRPQKNDGVGSAVFLLAHDHEGRQRPLLGLPSVPKGQLPSAPRAPLLPLSVVGTLFNRIAMDFIGPLPCTARDYRFTLVIMDYATRFPEVVPMRTMQAMESLER